MERKEESRSIESSCHSVDRNKAESSFQMSEHSEAQVTISQGDDVVPDVPIPTAVPNEEEDAAEPDLEEQRFTLPQAWSPTPLSSDENPPNLVDPLVILTTTSPHNPRPFSPDIFDLLYDSDSDDNLNDDNDLENSSRGIPRRSCIYWTTRLLCFPVWLLVTVAVISTVFAFCVIPAIFLITLVVTCYYCCSRDPIPLDVLLQALFLDEENENNPAPQRSKEEIKSLLLCRSCLDIQQRTDDDEPTLERVQAPNHAAILADTVLTIPTEQYRLTFSEPTSSAWTATRHLDVPGGDTSSSIGAVRTRSGDSQDDDAIEMTSVSALPEEDKSTDPISSVDNVDRAEEDDDGEYENGMGCGICLRRYKCGDVVAWSRNDAGCTHAYHVDCITDWLQKQPTCPNCRGPYIPLRSNKVARTNAEGNE